MIVVDENFFDSDRDALRSWRIPFRQIGFETGRSGMKDDEIIPLLIRLPRPTLFTRDLGWYHRPFLHARYGVFVLDVKPLQTAAYLRRILRHSDFNTQAKRLGKVVRGSHDGITGWTLGAESERRWPWP